MDEARFQQAKAAYDAKDWRAAADGFIASVNESPAEGTGEAFHLAGNALMQLRKYQHAETVYQYALRDATYPKMTAVLVNLGTAQLALGAYAEAVKSFDVVLADPAYPNRFRVLQRRGDALHKMGRFDEAAADYIDAADASNPDRGKAFNNLGTTLLDAKKPAEAVEALQAALAIDGYDGKGKAAVNLGLAYVALQRYPEAVIAFEEARDAYGRPLSDVAVQAYETAKRATGQRETVEGWTTGEIQQPEDGAPQPVAEGEGGEQAVSQFFSRTDTEMRDMDREQRRKDRADQKAGSNPWARIAGAAAAVVLVVGLFAGVFFAGYGYPTQSQTVGGMLDAYKAGRAVTDFWIAAPTADVSKEMATIPPGFASFSIDAVNRSSFASKVNVTIKLDKGSPLRYTVSLSREGVGWKVIGIDNDWGTATP
jgi:tetratricopeptide (TPR) repeat protein